MDLGRDIFTGVTMAVCALASFTAAASMLSMAGMDFAGCFTASVLLALMGTLWLAWRGQAAVFSPPLTVTGYLVFIVAISHGMGWQVILGICFFASLLGFVFWQAGHRLGFPPVPQIFPWGIKLSLAVFLVFLGLKLGRIIITSPWQVTMLGDMADPLFFWSMAGLAVTVVLLAGRRQYALFAGMLVTAVATLAEGFWIIPAAPFFQPEGLQKVSGMLALPSAGADAAFYGLTVFSLAVMLSVIHASSWTALLKGQQVAAGVKRLLLFNALGALLGMTPLVLSPVVAANREAARAKRAGLVAAAVLALALFCEPVLAAIADFPAMVVPVLVGGGFLLLLEALRDYPMTAGDTLQRRDLLTVLVMVMILSLTGDFAAAIGTAAIIYALCRIVSRE